MPTTEELIDGSEELKKTESKEAVQEYDFYSSKEMSDKEKSHESELLPALKRSFLTEKGLWKDFTVSVKKGQNPEDIYPLFKDFKYEGTGQIVPEKTVRFEKWY